MTKEEIFQNFIDDPLLVEKNYISAERVNKLKLAENTGIKLLEVIKIAIHSSVDEESESVISRKLNQFLNK